MKKLRKIAVSAGAVIGALTLGVASAYAALTMGSVLISSDGALSLNGVASSVYSIGTSTTTGTITIGGTAQTGALTVGQSTGINTVGIGTGTGVTTVNIAAGATGQKNINIGTGAAANGVKIGSTTGTSSIVLIVGAGNFSLDGIATSTYAIGTSTTTGTIQIGGGLQTGNLTLGFSGGLNAVGIGTGTGSTTVNIATGIGSNIVNIATGATVAKIVKIADGAVANEVIIGSASGAASTTIYAGTGGINLNGMIYATSTVASPVSPGGGSAAVVGTDVVGVITSVSTLSVSSTLAFGEAHAANPVCIISPTNAAAAGVASTTYVTTVGTATSSFMFINHASELGPMTWNYFCLGK